MRTLLVICGVLYLAHLYIKVGQAFYRAWLASSSKDEIDSPAVSTGAIMASVFWPVGGIFLKIRW